MFGSLDILFYKINMVLKLLFEIFNISFAQLRLERMTALVSLYPTYFTRHRPRKPQLYGTQLLKQTHKNIDTDEWIFYLTIGFIVMNYWKKYSP